MARMAQFLALAVFVLAATAKGQSCQPGEILLKNDNLPNVPTGATPVGFIPGVCDSQPVTVGLLQGCFPGGQITPAHGEGILCVFDISQWQSVEVKLASVMAAHATGSPGVTFIVNLEFYDGLVAVPGGFVLGNQLFDLAAATGNNAQLTTHALNTIDVSPYSIIHSGPTLVMLVRMEFNLNGNCASIFGASAGFASDLATPTLSGKNYIDGIDICTGASSPTLLDMATVPPSVYRGNWILRACIVPGASTNPLSVNFIPTNTISSGNTAIVNFAANPSFAGDSYFGAPSLTLAPPGSPTPFPLSDPIFSAFLAGDPAITSLFINFSGVLPPSGTGTGLINLPLLPPSVLPISLHVAFGTVGIAGLTGISGPSTLTIQ